jgi:hypothetical protein
MRTSSDLTAIHNSLIWAAIDLCCLTPAMDKIAAARGAIGAAFIPIETSDRQFTEAGAALFA